MRALGRMRGRHALIALSALACAAAAFVQVRSRQAERRHRIRGRFIDVEGVRLHYVERGSGPALVLVHGLGSMIDDFVLSGLVARAAEHYRVIAIDRPGYGRSSRPRTRRWTVAAQAELLHAALRRLDVHAPVLIGHSLGASIALAYALRFPVERLVLVSGLYYPSLRFDAPPLIPPAIPGIGTLLRYTVSPVLGRLAWPAWLRLIFAPAPVPRRFRSFPAWMVMRPETLRAIGEDAAYLLPAVSAMAKDYKRLRVPTTVLAGRDDRYVSARAHSMRLQREIAGSELVVVPGAGHMLHHLAPEAVMLAALGRTPAHV
ncbi:MAG: alpha/beta fold hydrolase [Burkholderiales bacterium]